MQLIPLRLKCCHATANSETDILLGIFSGICPGKMPETNRKSLVPSSDLISGDTENSQKSCLPIPLGISRVCSELFRDEFRREVQHFQKKTALVKLRKEGGGHVPV